MKKAVSLHEVSAWNQLTQSMRPITLGITIVAIIPAAAASKPLPGQTGPDLVSRKDVVLNAAEAVVDAVDIDCKLEDIEDEDGICDVSVTID